MTMTGPMTWHRSGPEYDRLSAKIDGMPIDGGCRCQSRWQVDTGDGWRTTGAFHAATCAGIGIPVRLRGVAPAGVSSTSRWTSNGIYFYRGVAVRYLRRCPVCNEGDRDHAELAEFFPEEP